MYSCNVKQTIAAKPHTHVNILWKLAKYST